jgi:hypothetical protein
MLPTVMGDMATSVGACCHDEQLVGYIFNIYYLPFPFYPLHRANNDDFTGFLFVHVWVASIQNMQSTLHSTLQGLSIVSVILKLNKLYTNRKRSDTRIK